MKRHIILFVFAFFEISGSLAAQMTVSGILDSSVSMRAEMGDAPAFSYGVEEYANLRMQAKLRDRATVYGAVNFIATAGDYAAAGAGLLTPGQNYAAAIELERLYFRLSGESVDFDGGLMRIPFGYSQVWGSSDFLNPKNPLKPDARPRAVFGTALFWYPSDSVKLLGFGAVPRDPFSKSGQGTMAGLSMDQHWDKASLQVLYVYESPKMDTNQGLHRAGMSVKADLEPGLVMDVLYTYNSEAKTGLDGLSLSIGADYSFFDGDLFVLAEYLYNGAASSTAFNLETNIYGRHNENYLYTSFTWRFNDYTNASLALISGFDDVSFTPIVSVNHDLFQGAVLTVSAQIPLDCDLFSGNGKRGELGRYFGLTAAIRLRF